MPTNQEKPADTPITISLLKDDAEANALRDMLISAGYLPRTYSSAEEFLRDYDARCPGCILVDIDLPGMDIRELQRQLTKVQHGPLIVTTQRPDLLMTVVRSMEAGAFAFLESPLKPEKLIQCIARAVASDRGSRRQLQRVEELDQRLNVLSSRETDVLRLVSQGMPSKHISLELGISDRTVETHRCHIMRKLGVDSIVEAVAMWVERHVLSESAFRP